MNRRIIGIVAAIALASVGTFALVAYVQSAKDKALAGEKRVEVYVLSKTVPQNATIAEIKQSLAVVEVPRDVQVEGAVRDLNSLDDDLVAGVELQAGEQLLTSRLVDGSELTTTDVPKGLQEVTVALDPARAVGGELKPGDTVGVVLSYDPFELDVAEFDPANPFVPTAPDAAPAPTDEQTSDDGDDTIESPNMTHLTFHKVLVTGVQFAQNDSSVVDDSAEASEDGDQTADDGQTVDRAPSDALLVTLALSSPEVEQVVFAAEFGHIWLTAENADADVNGTRITTLGQAYNATEVAR